MVPSADQLANPWLAWWLSRPPTVPVARSDHIPPPTTEHPVISNSNLSQAVNLAVSFMTHRFSLQGSASFSLPLPPSHWLYPGHSHWLSLTLSQTPSPTLSPTPSRHSPQLPPDTLPITPPPQRALCHSVCLPQSTVYVMFRKNKQSHYPGLL